MGDGEADPLYQAVLACSRSLKMNSAAIAVAYRLTTDQVDAVLRDAAPKGPSATAC